MKKILFILLSCHLLHGDVNFDIALDMIKNSQHKKSKALKEALDISTNYAINQLKNDGYLKKARILLPSSFQKISKVVIKMGGKKYIDKLERDINLAAGEAIGKSKPIFKKAIMSLNIADVNKLINANDDAITKYFETKTSNKLINMIQPIIKKTTDKNKLSSSYARVLKIYNSSSWFKGIFNFFSQKPMSKEELDNFVAKKAVEKSFLFIAKEEKKIRKNPFSYSSKIIKEVFR